MSVLKASLWTTANVKFAFQAYCAISFTVVDVQKTVVSAHPWSGKALWNSLGTAGEFKKAAL